QFALANFSITNSSFDLHRQDISLGTIELNGGRIKATRFADGNLSPLEQLRKQPTTDDTATIANSEADKPWKIRAERVDLQKFALELTDFSLAKTPHINIPDFNLQVENLSYPEAGKSPFSLAVQVGKKGSISADGTLIHTPLQLRAQTDIKAFPLTFFNNFVPEGVRINLKSGHFFSNLEVNLNREADKFTGHFSGELHISDFDLRDPISAGGLLIWKDLNLDGITGELAPLSLHIKDIVLSDYLANILITPTGQVNLTSITAPATETDGQGRASMPSRTEETVATGKTTAAEPPLDISIDTLTLQGGTVAFIDRHLTSTFSTTMYELGGRVTGLASAEEMQADVDLRGQLENHSPLTISGKINPLSRDLFADLTLSFKEIDLTPMTPYSGTYLGYVIDKGKLHLDLNYHIEQQQIQAKNRVMIDQLTLGDTVASNKATSLPVAFAIALLQDNNGEIHLDIPISGDLNDPDFSVGGIIFTVLKNLLVKAATSPFSLLTSMLGGDEDFSNISFASGLTTIDTAQLVKLESLAEMLAKRPALTLEISGFSDKEQDPGGYRKVRLQQMLVAAKLWKMEEDDATVTEKAGMVIDNEEYPDILLTVYKEAEFPRPRNTIGVLKKLPATEMEKLLLANIMVDEKQLQELAKTRAMTVRDALVTTNETIKSRLFLKKTDIYQPPKNGAASRVEFNISSR
ncbi:MAG: DUF748 domain-containing protein, partial [Thermodesulfobacteriota bacterium]|nr:DUF748 domain-containing protein [Thermodesulfobacteriota bacterium]